MESPSKPERMALQSDSADSGEPAPVGGGNSEVPAPAPARDRLKGVAALKLHLSLLFGLAFCAVAFRFELSRALGGNSLSWAYVGEWPFFAGFGIYFWWFILNGRERRPKKTDQATVAPEYANMAAQWQEEQRRLLEQQHGSGQPISHETSEERFIGGPDDTETPA